METYIVIWQFVLLSLTQIMAVAGYKTPEPPRIGCVASSQSTVLTQSPGNYDMEKMDHRKCAVFCVNHTLAGLTRGKLCVCGSGSVSHSENSSCLEPCTGNVDQYCGGTSDYDIYDLRQKMDHVPSFTCSPPTLYEPASLTVSLNGGDSSSGYILGDPFVDQTPVNLYGNNIQYTFTEWGDDVKLKVTNADAKWQDFTLNVGTVGYDSNDALRLECDSYGLVGEPFECVAKLIFGTQANITYTIDNVVTTMLAADPISANVGRTIPQSGITEGKGITNGLTLALTTFVPQSVYVHGFEMNVNKSGSAFIVVLRPLCQNNEVYCVSENGCCDKDARFSEYLYNDTNVLGNELVENYTVVYTTELAGLVGGYNVKKLPSDDFFEYRPGDILGFVNTGSSATFSVIPGAGAYVEGLTFADLTLNSRLQLSPADRNAKLPGTICLTAVASIPSSILISINADISGERNLTLSMTDEQGTAIANKKIKFFNKIGNISFVSQSPNNVNACIVYGPLNKYFNITAYLTSGTDPVAIWKTDDSNLNTSLNNSGEKGINISEQFMFSTIGGHVLSLGVTNQVSGRSIHARVVIEEEVEGFAVSRLDRTTNVFYQYETAKFSFTITKGTNVTFSLAYNNSQYDTELMWFDFIFKEIVHQNVSFVAKNMVSSQTHPMLIDVVSATELILPEYATVFVPVNVTCKFLGGKNRSVVIAYGDQVMTTSCGVVNLTLNESGIYEINCWAMLNNYTSRDSGKLVVLEEITDLKILPIPTIPVNTRYLAEARIATGNNVVYTWQPVNQSNVTNSTWISFETPGFFNLTVLATNAISEKVAYIIVWVQTPIGEVLINASSNPTPTSNPVTFVTTVTAGTDVNYTADNVELTTSSENTATFQKAFSEGWHAVEVYAENLISNATGSYSIYAQEPVTSPIDIDCTGLLFLDGSLYVETGIAFQCRLTTAYATDTNVVWKTNSVEHMRTVFNTTSKPQITNVDEFSFDHPGLYIISVHAFNNVSAKSNETVIYVDKRISGLQCHCSTTVKVNAAHRVFFTISEGSNASFTCYIDDSSQTTKTSLVPNLDWSYDDERLDHVHCIAANAISNETCKMDIIVQHEVASLVISSESNLFASVGEEVNITWSVQGTNVSTNLSWGDGVLETISFSACNHEASNKQYSCETKHRYKFTGEYKITLESFNLLTTSKVTFHTVAVEEAIDGLSIVPGQMSTTLYRDFTVSARMMRGSNVEFVFKFGNNEEVKTNRASATTKFKLTGYYTLSVFAKNNISQATSQPIYITVNQVPEPVKPQGLRVSTVEPLRLGEDTAFKVEWVFGALFACKIELGDENIIFDKPEEEMKSLLRHRYTKEGNYQVTVSCSNEFGTDTASTLAKVHKTIGDLELTTTPEKEQYPSAQIIYFNVIDGGSFLTLSASKDGDPIACAEPHLSSRYIRFPGGCIGPGKNKVNITLSNHASRVDKSIVIDLVERIDGVSILVNPHLLSNQVFYTYFNTESGSEMSVTFDFGDDTSVTIPCSHDTVCSCQHTYKSPGLYRINVNASNMLGQFKDVTSVDVSNPILAWDFSSADENGSPSLILNYNDTIPFPTNATYQLTFHDPIERRTSKTPLPLDNPYRIPHHLNKVGCHEVEIKMENKVTIIVKKVIARVRGTIIPATIVTKTLREAIGVTGNIFPLEYAVAVSSTNENTCLNSKWTVEHENGTSIHVDNSSAFTFEFPSAGKYKISLELYDEELSWNTESSIILDRSVTGLYFHSQGVAEVNKTVTFALLAKSLGTHTNFAITFGDGTSKTVTDMLPVSPDFYIRPESNVPFDTRGYYYKYIDHIYSEVGQYSATVRTLQSTVVNRVSVSLKPCSLPEADILGGDTNFTKATILPYERTSVLYCSFNKTCGFEDRIVVEWKIYKADVPLLRRVGGSVPPQKELIVPVPNGMPTNEYSLQLTKNGLKPGFYQIQLSYGFKDVSARKEKLVYVEIERPALKVYIHGGSARSVPWEKQISLDASMTYDPVDPLGNNLKFEWSCQKREDVNAVGGCFGYGEKLSQFSGNITIIREKLLVEKFTYIFTVNASTTEHGGAHGSFTQEVSVQAGDPPEVTLRCNINCEASTNPSSQISLVGSCRGNCEDITYVWRVDSPYQITWRHISLTPQNSSNLVLKENTLLPGTKYSFSLNGTNKRGQFGFATHDVIVKSPPSGGTCAVTPAHGVAIYTRFAFQCSDWLVDDGMTSVLKYRVSTYRSDIPSEENLIHFGLEPAANNLELPRGRSGDHQLNVKIRVIDAIGSFKEVIVNVKVMPNNDTALNLSMIETRSKNGDIQGVTRLVAAMLAEQQSSTGDESDADAARKQEQTTSLVEILVANTPSDTDSLVQVVQVLHRVISQDKTNVGQEAQDLAMRACQNLSRRLQEEIKGDSSPNEVVETANFLLATAGNILTSSYYSQQKLTSGNTTNSQEDLKVDKSRETTETGLNLISQIGDTVSAMIVPGQEPLTLRSDDISMQLEKKEIGDLGGSSTVFPGTNGSVGSSISLPQGLDGYIPEGMDPISVMTFSLRTNPYESYNTSNLTKSNFVDFTLKSGDGTEITLQKLEENIVLNIEREVEEHSFCERDENKTTTNSSIESASSKLYSLSRHHFVKTLPDNALVFYITPNITSGNITLYLHDTHLTVKNYHSVHFLEVVNNPGRTAEERRCPTRRYFSQTFSPVSDVYAGIAIDQRGVRVAVNYTIVVQEVGCYFWNEKYKMYDTAGCQPGSNSTDKLVTCYCNHATLFGSNVLVKPNVIDIEKEILNLANLGKYPALLATICVILGVYILALVWAKRKDRLEVDKDSIHVSVDNQPSDRQRYEVTLSTGSRKNAGTTAEPSLIICGSNGESEPHCLQRTSPVSFQRSSRDSYLVTTPSSLGPLEYIRIWHDNNGTSPSFYLNEVMIRDVEKHEVNIFMCNNWLACDEGDGLVERIIPVSSDEELKDFQYLFFQNSSEGFTDGHLWFSIFLRPPRNRFTHVQRVSCCLCLLLCTMLTNAMFFNVEVKKENNVDIDVGPYEFTWHEVVVGIQSSLIVFPINFLIVTMFRRIGPRPKKSEKYREDGRKQSIKSAKTPVKLMDIDIKKENVPETNEKIIGNSRAKKVRMLPWWFRYISWLLLIAVTFTAGFFTLLYGLSFGKKKQEQWLTALVVSVFQDILVSQPLKILALSLFVAFVIRKPSVGETNEENQRLIEDELWIQQSLYKINPEGKKRDKAERSPPDELMLRKTRIARQKERKMFSLIREIVQFFIFWWIVLMIAYGYREHDAHLLTNSMRSMFTQLGENDKHFNFSSDYKDDLYKVRNRKELIHWLEDVILPNLFHEELYNGDAETRKGFIGDGVCYLIGNARLRMLRVRKDTCKMGKFGVSDIIDGCEAPYSLTTEFQKKYNGERWAVLNRSLWVDRDEDPWQYRTQTELHERPYYAQHSLYRGGGYVKTITKKSLARALYEIGKLRKKNWIDVQTRAVFVEFTVFSPNKNLHGIVTIVFECLASGGCFASPEVLVTRLDEMIGNYRIFILFCEIVFVLYLLFFTYHEVKHLFKDRLNHWKLFWNWIEMGIVTIGWCCVVFYILRFLANRWTISHFREKTDAFIPFRYVATADLLYGTVLSFLVFFTSIKFLRLMRFNRRMSLLGSTLKRAGWDLLNFAIIFVIAFFACVSLAFLLFNTNIDVFSSLISTAETFLMIILGKFKYMTFSHDTFVMSFFVIFIYVIVVIFILMNVFLAIINDTFAEVRADNDLQENEHEIVDYVTSRLKSWVGMKTTRPKEKSDFEFEYGFRPKYVSANTKAVPPAVALDKKVQDLLEYLDKQEDQTKKEEFRVDEMENKNSKMKALLLVMMD